ncbi:MAG: hypothetical protein H6993_07335 [Pseudomonadales bacterium]|nr:hypothetical protein [Pseudomonadales bacterium]MCP5183758.1 hypothetical protein [Pseudomonadales bacterium]
MFSGADDELIDYLTRVSGLPAGQCRRLVQDVVAHFNEGVEDFVQRRHRELQQRGLKNAEIYTLLVSEVASRRFPAASLTERQLRRMIYG